MIIKEINNLNLIELKKLLKQVKNYKDLKTKLWKRWVSLFNRNLENKNLFVVEYFWDYSIDTIYNISSKVFKEIFWNNVLKDEIEFKRNDKIKWWIKIYKDDSLVDLSFLKFEKQISL